MMQQYESIKDLHKDCLLFYRLGDFYEMFFDDAITASRELDLALTGRDCGLEEKAPMCGVPYHAADGYIAKLVEKGYKVAICEQLEDPKLSKGLVKRDVIRIVTPGTVLDCRVLDEGKNNYIACVYQDGKSLGMAFCDVSTGEFLATSASDERRVFDELGKLKPSEIIANSGFQGKEALKSLYGRAASEAPSWMFGDESALKRLIGHFQIQSLESFGLKETDPEVNAAGALLEYLAETQKNSLSHISALKKYSHTKYMSIDTASRRNLELTETIRDRTKKRSLLGFLDLTKTPLGARTLRGWIEQPLLNVEEITKRLDAVGELKENAMARGEIQELLKPVRDIERIVALSAYQAANARDLCALRGSLGSLPAIKEALGNLESELLSKMGVDLDILEDMQTLLSESLAESPPYGLREGGLIGSGYSEELDRLREAKTNGAKWLEELEAREREETGIKNLKIKFNRVFGYSIEVTNSRQKMVPDRYKRRQTLSNCERYTTDELEKIADEILGAEERIVALEYELFNDVRGKVAGEAKRFQKLARALGYLDSIQSLAEAADKYRYCKPAVDNEGVISIKAGRHPVVERMTGRFVPNDTELDLEDNRMAVITGPNMAGKSTYMRQVALIALMAQAGSFVPAESARIGVSDRIFTRVGASDDLATGQSTFMVEMTEVANILNNATKKSLLILDEIGRGTSTFDGLSIAWAVLEYIADKSILGAKTLFATHYHELAELEGKVEGVKNYNASVQEQGDSVVFLRKIARGSASRSYGIQVASLAGLPTAVLDRSKEILADLSYVEPARKAPSTDAIRPRRKAAPSKSQILNQILMEDLFGDGFK
jgi:DNA mismatch repair protein MutS